MVSVVCCTCQSTSLVATTIMVIGGSGQRRWAMPVRDSHLKESMAEENRKNAIAGRRR
jgi:hypothetical protein